MSDIMIPGVTNSGIDTDSMVEQIMEAERQPVTRMEEQIDAYEEEQAAWAEIGRRISNLRESSRLLFSFENPFADRIATSSDDDILTATAARDAIEGSTEVSVLQLAQADRFISRNLPTDFSVASGRYGFRVGEDEEFFTFAGGSLQEFADTVNRRAGDLVAARVVRNTADTDVILVEALRTGSQNPLQFLEAARTFALEASILEEALDRTVDAPIISSTVTGFNKPLDPVTVTVQNGQITVGPGGEASIRFPGSINTEGSMVLAAEVRVQDLYESWVPPAPPAGPEIRVPGQVSLGDVTIVSEPSTAPLPDWVPPDPPTVVNDLSLLYLQSGQEVIPLPDLTDTDGFQTIEFSIASFANTVQALLVRNENSHREIAVRNVRLYDPTSRGDAAPANAISIAQDAIVELQGIQVVRPSNTIDDLISGVTLQLNGSGNGPVDVDIAPDRESVKNALIELVFHYNQLMTEINILTRSDQSIVDDITYFTDEEREDALLRMGMMQGDFTLSNLKNSLQTLMMNPYPTSAGAMLTLLSQMGISTNASGPGGAFNASRLRGYLEINESKLDTTLQTEFAAISELFGSDTNGDRVVDSGVAFRLDETAKPFVQVGGIIAMRSGTIDGSIARAESRIERENERLDRREQELRSDFATMEAAMGTLEENRRTLDNLQSQTANN